MTRFVLAGKVSGTERPPFNTAALHLFCVLEALEIIFQSQKGNKIHSSDSLFCLEIKSLFYYFFVLHFFFFYYMHLYQPPAVRRLLYMHMDQRPYRCTDKNCF